MQIENSEVATILKWCTDYEKTCMLFSLDFVWNGTLESLYEAGAK
jgi:hypothetical protein